MDLFLIGGTPGSGKSTVAALIAPRANYSANMWMVNADGNYEFDRGRLAYCHQSCIKAVEAEMQCMTSKISVANTFTQSWELGPYLDLADRYGYRPHCLILENRHRSTSIHGVPEKTIARMHGQLCKRLEGGVSLAWPSMLGWPC